MRVLPFPAARSPVTCHLAHPAPLPLRRQEDPVAGPSRLGAVNLAPTVCYSSRPLFRIAHNIPLISTLTVTSSFLSLTGTLAGSTTCTDRPSQRT